jgi:nitrite reductase/ring-hydroxylating ferredoxin subunit
VGSATATTTPIILAGTPPPSVNVGQPYSYQPTVTSSSGTVTFAVEALPAWASFDTSTGMLSGTPGPDDVGLSADITITATNGSTTGSVGPFNIRVNPAATAPGSDAPPTITGTPVSAVTAGQSYTFQPALGDADGNALTASIANRPSWASFDTTTGKLSGNPTSAQVGTYTNIVITVTDGTSSVSLPAFSITVVPVGGDKPVIGGTPVTSIAAGAAYSFQPTASDPDSKSLTFSIVNAPAWATFNAATGKLTGTPGAAQAGTYAGIVISAKNGTATVSLPAFTITVTAPVAADTPLIGGTPAPSVVAGQSYDFQPTASDPAGKTLTFAIVNRPTWATFNTATGQLSGTPGTTQTGSYPGVGITVTNGTSSAALPVFSIVVSKPATPGVPTISGTPTTSVVAGNAYRFTPTATDPSGGTLTFSIANAPSWAAFSTATGELSGTPTEADVGTYSNITISVSDGKTTAVLPAFPISVTESASGSVTLSWTAPTQNTNGTALTNLAGYYIHYGTSPTALTKSVQITNPGVDTYVISNLSAGTWYFSMTAYTTADVQSPYSAVASGAIN